METKNLLLKIALAVTAALMIVAVLYGAISKYTHDKQIVEMANVIAARDKTIEVQQGVYDKLAAQSKNLGNLLTDKDVEIVALKKELKSKGQDLLTASQLVIKWKKAYEGALGGTQHPDPVDDKRIVVEFGPKDFGPVTAKGWTKTNPAEAWVSIAQSRPLKLTLVVSQDENKLWHTYTTSSEENMQVEIALSSVNPWLLKTKWYEQVAISGMVAVGKDGNGITGLVGVGLTIPINQFNVGPMLLGHLSSSQMDPMIGVYFAWRPWTQ